MNALSIHHTTDANVILGTARVIVIGFNEIEVELRALCDNGSQVNLITLSAIHQLSLKMKSQRMDFTGVGGKSLGESLGSVELKIRLTNGNFIYSEFFVVKKITR